MKTITKRRSYRGWLNPKSLPNPAGYITSVRWWKRSTPYPNERRAKIIIEWEENR